MRKILPILSLAAAAIFATPALAAPDNLRAGPDQNGAAPAEVATGAAVGTVVGVGAFNGWWGSTVASTLVPTTVAGSIAAGGVAGIGTAVLIDAAVQPCRGFHAMFDLSHGQCVNGEYVGYAPQRVGSLHGRRVIR